MAENARETATLSGLIEQRTFSPPPLRITRIRIHRLVGPLREPFGWSLNWTRVRTATLVEVNTDEGLTGWGEGNCDISVLAAQVERLMGRSPFEMEAIHEELRYPAGPQQMPGPCAAPALDIALWDLAGKALGLPVSALMGKRFRTEVQPYVTALYRKAGKDLSRVLAEEARAWVEQGYRVLKMKTGYSPELDCEIVRAVREAVGPGVGLAIDSNCAYDVSTAIRIGARLESLDLLWWEEPLLSDDLEGYERLRQLLCVPVAAGETGSTEWLIRNYVEKKLVDILQPDLGYVGLSGARTLTRLCQIRHMRLIPHNWGTAVGTAATLHWLATIPPLTPALNPPEVMLEFDQTEHPFRDAIVLERIQPPSPGESLRVPEGPGLGVTVIPEALREFREALITLPQ